MSLTLISTDDDSYADTVTVPPSNYAKDCALGRQRAADLIELLRQTGNPLLFANAVRTGRELRGVIGPWGGEEIGFCQALAEALLRRP